MKYIYESISPRNFVLRPERKKVNALGFVEITRKVQVIFDGSRAFTLDENWCKTHEIDIEVAKKELESMGGSDIRLLGTFKEGEEVTVKAGKEQKAPKVVDGPTARDHVESRARD